MTAGVTDMNHILSQIPLLNMEEVSEKQLNNGKPNGIIRNPPIAKPRDSKGNTEKPTSITDNGKR